MPSTTALKSGLFFVALVILVFFLKITCPLSVGCLADPFVLVFFSPILLLENTFLAHFISASREPFFIVFFWFLVGVIGGYLFDVLWLEGRRESRLPPRGSF